MKNLRGIRRGWGQSEREKKEYSVVEKIWDLEFEALSFQPSRGV